MDRVKPQLILGPAASGKTEACLEQINSTRRSAWLAPIWVVLPNRAQVVAFRRRFAARGGGLGVRIETVDAFVEELAIRLGCQRPKAAGPVRRRMVQSALRELQVQGDLPHFGPIANTAGLSYLFSDRILELKRAGWTPAALAGELDQAGQDLLELQLAFSRYQQHLDALGWEDEEGLTSLVADSLQAQSGVLSDLALIIFDGFDSFTRNQLNLLAAMVPHHCELVLTLPAAAEQPAASFPRFHQALEELKQAIPSLSLIELDTKKKLPVSPIRQLAASLQPDSNPEKLPADSSLSWLRAHSINAEVREALRWLKAVHLRRGIPLQACALVLTEPEPYEAYVREAAREYGIPLRFGMGQQLHKAASMVAILDLLRLPLFGWSRRLTLDAIRSPFYDLSSMGLAPADANALESASYWGQVVGGAEQWLETLERLAGRTMESWVEDEGAALALPAAAEAQRLLQAFSQFRQRLEPGPAKALSGWVEWLEDLLQEVSYFDQVASDQEEAAALRFREILRAMLLSEQVIGDSKQEYAAFLTDLEGALEKARYRPKLKWSKAALSVESLEAVRGLRFQAVALVGLSEGQLPMVEREDPLISEEFRARLGLEPRLGRDQRSLFYSAISRADGLLLLTRPTLAEDGEIWQPSPYWLESLRLFGLEDEQVPLYRRGNSRPMSEAASEHEVVFQAVRRGSLPQAYASIEPRLEPLRQARPLIEARLQAEPAGEYEGDLSLLTSILADQLGQGHSWSPSRLESFGTCPHYYLSSTLLGLQELEEPELGPDARQLGSLLHEILELGYQAASDPADPELVTAAVRELAAERFERAPQEFGFRPSPLWHIEAEQLTESLVESISGLAELGAGWQPFGYEAKFGIGGQPALEVETTEGTIQVRGVIDRLDRKGGQLRVIDYKTGGSHLSRSDLLQGRRLQLPLYALAAERALEAGEVTSGLYWNIRGGKAGSLKLESFNATWQGDQVEGVRGAYQVLHDHLSAFLAAIRTGQFQPKPPQGGCPDYCPASAWCWRYTPGFRR